MNDYVLKSVSDYSLVDSAALFTHAFTGYIGGNVQLNATSLAGLIARDNVDLNASRILVHEGQPVGFALIARQGWTSRVAAMGIVPEIQGKGAGRWLLENLQSEARTRGEKGMVLEAFEQNTPAVMLYTRMGFQIVRRLYGYTAERIESLSADVQEIDVFEVGKRLTCEGAADLPWQVSGATTMRGGFPAKAYQDRFAPIDPITAIAFAAGKPVLFQFAEHDRFVSAESAAEYFAAALPPKTTTTYPDQEHEMDGQFVQNDRLNFLRQYLSFGYDPTPDPSPNSGRGENKNKTWRCSDRENLSEAGI